MATIKFTVAEMFGFIGSAEKILANDNLPVKARYTFSKLSKKIEAEVKHYNEQRFRLIEKHCKKDADGKPVIVKDKDSGKETYDGIEGNDLYKKDYAELVACECEVNMIPVSNETIPVGIMNSNDMAKMDKFFIE